MKNLKVFVVAAITVIAVCTSLRCFQYQIEAAYTKGFNDAVKSVVEILVNFEEVRKTW